MQVFVQWISLTLAACVSLAVAGLSTGLGATFIDLKQRNPSAIVSGFGGTLDLVLSLTYIMATMLPFAALFHLHHIGSITQTRFHLAMTLAFIWLILATLLATWLPLAIGRRSLMKQEY